MDHQRSVVEAVAITETAPFTYVNQHNPDLLNSGVGFGGWTIALGINAAAASVDTDEYRLYSATGYFLTPVGAKQRLIARVKTIRNTRTFATRFVEIIQQINGKDRPVMTLTADFQRPEKASVLRYSPPMKHAYSNPDKSLSVDQLAEIARSRRIHPKIIHDFQNGAYRFKWGKFECKSAPEGMWGTTVYGLAPPAGLKESDTRPPFEKTTLEYLRSHKPLKDQHEHALAVAWLQDGGTSFVPPLFEQIPLQSLSAVSSLDFALRIFVNDLDLNEFNAREEHPVTAGDGRTYVEARMFDAAGRLVSSMTQQCILRPKEKKTSKI